MEVNEEFKVWIKSGKDKLDIYNSDHARGISLLPTRWGITVDDNGEIAASGWSVCAIGACLLGEDSVDTEYWWVWEKYVAKKFGINVYEVDHFIDGYDTDLDDVDEEYVQSKDEYFAFGQEMRKEHGF